MTVLTELSAVRMREAQLLATACECGHELRLHRLTPRRPGQNRRYDPTCMHRHRGDFDCRCEGFTE